MSDTSPKKEKWKADEQGPRFVSRHVTKENLQSMDKKGLEIESVLRKFMDTVLPRGFLNERQWRSSKKDSDWPACVIVSSQYNLSRTVFG